MMKVVIQADPATVRNMRVEDREAMVEFLKATFHREDVQLEVVPTPGGRRDFKDSFSTMMRRCPAPVVQTVV